MNGNDVAPISPDTPMHTTDQEQVDQISTPIERAVAALGDLGSDGARRPLMAPAEA
jgi:hypothetical protein